MWRRLLYSLLVLLMGSAAAISTPTPPPLAVVFVDLAGVAAWDGAREAQALADVQQALDWLRARGLPAPATAERTGALLATGGEWWEWAPDEAEPLTLFVVANHGAPWFRMGSRESVGLWAGRGRVLVLAESIHGLPALTAHELTHALTDLPDWPAPCDLDILCTPRSAYDAGTLGCVTLAALGTPCAPRAYLPWVEVRQ